MLVSVIMPVFNSMQFLQESIDSILNQSHKDFEFIILDDGSTEPVWDLIQSCLDTRIITIRNAKNIGLTKSLNICLDKVRGEFIVRHDSDDVSLPTRIEEQLNFFEEGIGFVTCWFDNIVKKNGIWKTKNCKKGRMPAEDLLSKYTIKNCGNDPGTIYSVEAVRKVGYFDERLYLSQTYNYNRRVQRFFKSKVLPKVLYLRRKWPGQVGKRVRKSYSEYKNVNWHNLANEYADERPIIK